MEILGQFPTHAHRAAWREHVIPWLAVASLALAVPLEGQSLTRLDVSEADRDRFGLFTDCALVTMAVIAEDDIRAMAENRLRAARLDASVSRAIARVEAGHLVGNARLSVVSTSYGGGRQVTFCKPVTDPLTGVTWWADTWSRCCRDMSDMLDEFILEYLRMNEEACP